MSEAFVTWAKAKNAAYTRRRTVYRKGHPNREHAVETAIYVAPVELRPKLAEDRET